jgi:hypothetical protein
MPFPYAQIVKACVLVYCLAAPFGYVGDTKWFTPLANFFLALMLFAVDETGVEIEDPYGKDVNDVRLKGVMLRLDEETAVAVADRHNLPKRLLLSHAETSHRPGGNRRSSQKARNGPNSRWALQRNDEDEARGGGGGQPKLSKPLLD